ncbi:origin of replication complex subunit 3 isoform X2 [Dioscorea cayenensis subsp. rotundata]|uniref:Origin of replication complex subunit 3 isoform X2 n=1 Tax=Dioscorea cayennensis subsp. rotundata TaxID=55577 RepID=A0AB40B2U3_DIOCR|nr:origin of replication complex subunit 3 isoform X2 [Dioscorea cayenensis subsp. rotundata]
MASCPSSDPPSPPPASDGISGNHNLQPFFVLHKASHSSSAPRKTYERSPASKKTKRRIDLSGSPSKPSKNVDDSLPTDPSDPIFDQLRFDAFNRTWSKIDTTIKDVLRKINLNLFDDVRCWVQQSFLTIRATSPVPSIAITCPYPLSTDALCKQIPTAFICTKNAEFVDDLLTFQELGEHLKCSGCHVANLSSLDFSAKHGIGSCISSLLRTLVPDAADVADISVLGSWYSEFSRHDNPVVVIIDDMERSNGDVLAEFILMMSEWAIKIPVIFIMGVATTVGAPKRLLPSGALRCLLPCKFTLGTPCERMNALIEAVLVKPCTRFTISHKVAVFLRSYFLKHDGTVTSFIRALKLACIKHFSMEHLSFLGYGVLQDDCEVAWLHKHEILPDVCKYTSILSLHKREKGFERAGDAFVNGLNELRRLHKNWGSIVMCLFETGKFNKMRFFDIFCEALDPSSYTLNCPDDTSSTDIFPGGVFTPAKGGSIAQAIYKIHEKVRELQLIMRSVDGGKILKENGADVDKSEFLHARKSISSINEKAATLLETIVRNLLVPFECIPFHEIICFKHVHILQTALIGDPRRTIQVDLLKSRAHLQCSCCGSHDSVISSSMHDTSIMYKLAQEYGDLINLHDWYQSFKATILGSRSKTKRKGQSPASKKMKTALIEGDAMIQARFCRAVIELQITGLLRMPSKRRPDFVQRVAFGL